MAEGCRAAVLMYRELFVQLFAGWDACDAAGSLGRSMAKRPFMLKSPRQSAITESAHLSQHSDHVLSRFGGQHDELTRHEIFSSSILQLHESHLFWTQLLPRPTSCSSILIKDTMPEIAEGSLFMLHLVGIPISPMPY